MLQPGERVAQAARADERILDFKQVHGHEHGPALGLFQRATHVARAAKADVRLLFEQLVGFARLVEPLLHRRQIVATAAGRAPSQHRR